MDDVRDQGPLYTHTIAIHLRTNGFILNLIGNEILSVVALPQKLPKLKEKCILTGSEIDLLYQDLTCVSKSIFRNEILPNIPIVSATHQMCLNVTEMNVLETFLGSSCPTDRLLAFNRLEITATSSVICGLAYKNV